MNKNSVPFRLRALVWCALASSAGAQTTTCVSVTPGGTPGANPSQVAAISADGRFVAFQSHASNLVAGDTNNRPDIFVRDRQTGQTTRVSVSSSGVQANGDSSNPYVSADGRLVVFQSGATNLIAIDNNLRDDVFVHDRQTGQTTRVSVSSTGAQANARSSAGPLSADGRFVAFTSIADNLVPGDTNNREDTFVRDRQTGVTARVSVSSGGAQANLDSFRPSISADGRLVAFDAIATNLVPGDTNSRSDVFVHDRQTGETSRVSVASGAAQGDAESFYCAISADGRFVAYASFASNLVAGDTNSNLDIFVHDRQTAQVARVSVSSTGEETKAGGSANPSISADGRYIAFQSNAFNLVPGNTSDEVDVFVHDRQTGLTSRASLDWLGNRPAGYFTSFDHALSEDGRLLAFSSHSNTVVQGDNNGVSDVFIRTLLPLLPSQSFPADSEPAAIAIANFDVDLDVFKRGDLAVVNAGANSVSLLDNNGVPGQPPSFAPPTPERTFAVGAGPTAAAPGNLDDNVYPDLIVANTAGGTVSILLGAQTGGFTTGQTLVTPGAPRALSLADIDRDGWQDIIVARRDADAISCFRNLGFGVFGPDQPQAVPPGGRPSGVGSGDLDNDKDIDVVVSLDQAGAILVFPNTSPINGPFTFGPAQSFAVGAGSPRAAALVLSDFDFDGFLDVAVAVKNTGSIAVLRNLGVTEGGVWLGFAPPVSFATGSLPVSVGAGNVYGFGFPDLFTANAFVDANNLSSVSVLKNVTTGPGDINFEPEVRIETPPLAAHITAFDVNLDNRLDIGVATGFDAGSLLDSPGASARTTPRGSPSGVAAVLAGASPSVALAPCDGDANGDRYADFIDLNIVLGYYATSGPAVPGDLNADGVVDFLDLNIVLSAFGSAC